MSKMPAIGIKNLINEALDKRNKSEKKRDYLGASTLGIECDRQLWYTFYRPKPPIIPRMRFLFDVGHMLEEYMVNVLKEGGLIVYEKDANGEQFGFVDGKIAGHIDGVIQGIPESEQPHLLELKTANDKNFAKFQAHGYQSNLKYWVQVHVYMYKMGLKKALAIVINKNNCEIYAERITLDEQVAKMYLLRGHDIISKTEIPERKYNYSSHFQCKFCDFADECWGRQSAAISVAN